MRKSVKFWCFIERRKVGTKISSETTVAVMFVFKKIRSILPPSSGPIGRRLKMMSAKFISKFNGKSRKFTKTPAKSTSVWRNFESKDKSCAFIAMQNGRKRISLSVVPKSFMAVICPSSWQSEKTRQSASSLLSFKKRIKVRTETKR